MKRLESTGCDGVRATAARGVVAALLATGLSVVGAAEVAAAQPAADDTLEWLDDYEEALARARATGQPLLVEFRCAP